MLIKLKKKISINIFCEHLWERLMIMVIYTPLVRVRSIRENGEGSEGVET